MIKLNAFFQLSFNINATLPSKKQNPNSFMLLVVKIFNVKNAKLRMLLSP